MSGTIVRYDGGAVAPHNRQAHARSPPPAAATDARQAPITRKRPNERDAHSGRLLGVVPRVTGTNTATPQRNVTRLLHAFMWPALPGSKKRLVDEPADADRGAHAKHSRHAPPPSRAIMLKPPAPQPPVIQITYALPQDDLAGRLQCMLQQALAQGLGPLLQRRPVVVAQAIAAHPPPALALRAAPTAPQPPVGLITGPGPTQLPAQLLLTAAGLREEAQRAVQQHPRLTRQLIHQRAAAGVPTTLAAIEAAEVVHETAQLIVLLPPYALATVCGTSIDRIYRATPQQVMDHLLRHTRRRWVASTISGARCAYVRLLLWLEAHDIEHDGTLDGMTLGSYLDDVDRTARARCAARQQLLAASGGARPRGTPQTGAHAAKGQWSHLDYLRRHWGLQLATPAARARYEPSRRPPKAAPPPAIRAVFTLEALLVRHQNTLSNPVLNAAAATLFLAYAVSRVEQAQSCYFDGWQDGFLHGVFLLDKHPNPDKRRPRRFWVPATGLLGTCEWMDILVRTLTGNEDACAVFLENDSPTGDPFRAIRTFPAAMAKDRVAVAKRAIWRRIVGIQIANENTLHSERHFLPHAAEARGEPPEEAVELGRWSGSTAQDADLEPTLRAKRCHRLRVGTLPDRYAQAAKVGRVIGIITRQMDAIRKTIWSRWDALPWAGGWQLLAATTQPP